MYSSAKAKWRDSVTNNETTWLRHDHDVAVIVVSGKRNELGLTAEDVPGG
jgi:hypothetical protein